MVEIAKKKKCKKKKHNNGKSHDSSNLTKNLSFPWKSYIPMLPLHHTHLGTNLYFSLNLFMVVRYINLQSIILLPKSCGPIQNHFLFNAFISVPLMG
jgi:hypothetical protein